MALHPVARVVFDPDARIDRLSLYADGPFDVTGRHTGRVASGASVSFATYFNAFPGWHWREFTTIRKVQLAIDLVGRGAIEFYRSDAQGATSRVDTRQVEGSLATAVEVDLEPLAAGGWVWFDLRSADVPLELRGAQWQVDMDPRETRLATLSMTTMNKPGFALGVLRRIAQEPAALAALDEVLVIDQGSEKVAHQAEFADVRGLLEGRLRVIDQGNLGGSGGFARGMIETLDARRSGSVILLDDDVELEPESVARAVAFASFTTVPTVVGGHFFDLYRPMQLHAWAEAVDPVAFDWGPIGEAPVDFSRASLRELPDLHAPARPDYNGWWFSLLPVDVLEDVGLSLPAFLKWDDAEFGLRAAAAGYSTVSLPGMAVWHVTWLDKNDALGWQAFYHARNRLVAALVDGRRPGRRLPRLNLDLDIRFLATMDYHVVELRHLAYESVLAGPDSLHPELGSRLPAVLEAMRSFESGRPVPIDGDAPPSGQGGYVPGIGGLRAMLIAARLLLRQALTPETRIPVQPEARLGVAEARWWRIGRYRHVLSVASDHGSYQRHRLEPKTLRRMTRRAFADYARMRREWRRLGDRYRRELSALVAPDTWRRTLGID